MYSQERLAQDKKSFLNRFGHDFKIENIKFQAVMLMADVTGFEINMQIISDVLMS